MRISCCSLRAVLLLAVGGLFSASAQTANYSIRTIGTTNAYAGQNVYYDVVPVITSGTAATWYVNSVQLGGTPATFALTCRSAPCPTDSLGRPWDSPNAGSAILKVSIPSTLVPGQYQILLETASAGVVVKTNIPLRILPPPVPLPASPYLPPTPPIPGRAKWESTMTTLGRKWCNPTEVMDFNNEAQVWYYDGARVFFQIADYTGDRTYEACAYNIARQYRNFVIARDGRVPDWRLFSTGLRMAYERSGDTTYRDAVRLLATKSGHVTWAMAVTEWSIREVAYLTNALVDAERIGEPRSPVLARNIDYLLGHFDRLFVAKTAELHQTFYDGLGAEALINAYEVTRDPRIPPAIKTMLDWEWDYGWNKSTFQLVYNPEPYGPKCASLCQEYLTNLINLVVPAYGWYWSVTGDTTAQTRGDEMFSHALDSDIWYSGKMFSQNYRWSPLYVSWRTKTGTQPSFNLTATPTDRTVVAGNSTQFPLVLTSENGLTGSASLAVANAPAGITAQVNPAIVTLGSTAASATVNVAVAGTVAPGSYPLSVSATAAGVTRSISLNLTVSAPASITLSASGAVSVTPGTTKDIPVAITPANNFTGSVQLSASGAPAGITAVFLTNPVSVSGTTAASSVLRLTVPQSAAAGAWNLRVVATSGALVRSIDIPVTVSPAASFTLAASPSSVSVAPGASAGFTVSAVGQNGFNGVVSISTSGLPGGVTITPATSSLAVTGTTPASAALTVVAGTAVAPGSYNFTVSASANGLVRNINVALTVASAGSFNMSATVTNTTVTVGSTRSIGLILTPVNGFSGNVQVGVSGSGTGLTATLNSTTVPVSAAASAQFVLTLSALATAAPGMHNLRVTASAGTIVRTVDVTVNVIAAISAVTVTPSNTSLSVKSGGTVSTSVSIMPASGFTGTVYLYTDRPLPGGANSLSPSLISVTRANAGIAQNTTLTVGAGTTPPGTYSFSIVITTSAGRQRIPVTVNVTP